MFIPNRYVLLLSKFKEDVCQDPDADFTSSIKALASEFIRMGDESQKSLLETLLLSLYALDTDALRRDLAKLAVFGGAPAAPSQRLDLLRCLYNVMSFFIQDGFSDLIAMCDQVEDASRMEAGISDLDIWG
ncbi:hypothetical protein AALB19_18805 [Oscillospiraceae bacterium 50-58]